MAFSTLASAHVARCGSPATIIGIDRSSSRPITALLEHANGRTSILSYRADGTRWPDCDSKFDLLDHPNNAHTSL